MTVEIRCVNAWSSLDGGYKWRIYFLRKGAIYYAGRG